MGGRFGGEVLVFTMLALLLRAGRDGVEVPVVFGLNFRKDFVTGTLIPPLVDDAVDRDWWVPVPLAFRPAAEDRCADEGFAALLLRLITPVTVVFDAALDAATIFIIDVLVCFFNFFFFALGGGLAADASKSSFGSRDGNGGGGALMRWRELV